MIKTLAIGTGSNRLRLMLGLLLGIIGAALTVVYLAQGSGNESGGQSGATAAVVVATQDIPANTKITADMVTVKQLPVGVVLQGAFRDTTGVVDKVTSVSIVSGEQVLTSRVSSSSIALAEYGDKAPLSLLVPEGRRAFSLKTSEVAAAGGLIRGGDHVDVILSGGAAGVENSQAFLASGSACYVVQDIEVLAVGNAVKRVATDGGPAGVAAAATNPEAVSVTLAVTPEEAWWLAAAQQAVNEDKVGNQLWVALRPFGEHGAVGNLPVCGVIPGA